MKQTILTLTCLALAVAVTPSTAAGQSADAPEAIIYDAQSAMEVLKSLRRLGPGGHRQRARRQHTRGELQSDRRR